MSAWLVLKTIHVTAATVTITLFVIRGLWMMTGSARLRSRWVRIVPHVNDTILLAAGIGLAGMTYQYPLVHGWLTAKLLALGVYIGLGMVAMRFGKTTRVRATAWSLAVLTFAYVVAVALTRSPAPWAG